MNYGSSRDFLFTILQKLVTDILQMGDPTFIFYGLSGFVLACRDWQSPKLDNLKEIKLFYLRESLLV